MATKKKANTGHRLTPDQKAAIAAASPDVTNVELADKYGTTPQTVANYRHDGGARRGRRAPTAEALPRGGARGVSVQVEGDFLVIRVPRSKALVKDLVSQLLG